MVQSNSSRAWTLDEGFRSYLESFRLYLGYLDGEKKWALSLFPYYDTEDFDPFTVGEYLQAGGRADHMSVDVRRVDPDGVTRQYFVGRPGGDYSDDPSEEIFIDGRVVAEVYPNEVFEFEEAAQLFYAYFRTGTVSAPYVLRDMHI